MTFYFRNYVMCAVLTVLIWVMALTPMGYIPLFGVDVTLLCIPIIVGTCTLGLRYGLFLGFMFALTSLYMALMGRAGVLLAPILDVPTAMYTAIFLPRMLIPTVSWLIFKATAKWKAPLSYGLTALGGSFVNTVFFLGSAYILGGRALTESFQMSNTELLSALSEIVVSNGVLEAVLAMIVCITVLTILKKTFGLNRDDADETQEPDKIT